VTRYELLLFLHIGFSIVWIGSGFLFHVLGFRADRADDQAAVRKIADDLVALANTLFIPSSLLVLVLGILLTLDGPWSFGDLWITLGLVGWFLTFLTGTLWITPQSKRLQGLIERDAGLSAEGYAVARRMMTFARLDYVVLFLIVFDMVVKPTGDDVGTLVFMAAVLAAGAAYFGWRARAIAVPAAGRATA
jgi:uncharacterized membrane protein